MRENRGPHGGGLRQRGSALRLFVSPSLRLYFLSRAPTLNLSTIHLRLVPELALIESPAEQRRIYNAALNSLYRRPAFWIAVLLGPLALAGALGGFFSFLKTYLRVPGILVGGITGGIVGGGGMLIVQYVLRRPLRKFVRTRLVEMGIPVCIPCGYDLRGQLEQRCPECGQPAAKQE